MAIINNLPVNEEIARAIMGNPQVTYDDLESLYFSITNCEAMGGWNCPILSDINKLQGEMTLRSLWEADE